MLCCPLLGAVCPRCCMLSPTNRVSIDLSRTLQPNAILSTRYFNSSNEKLSLPVRHLSCNFLLIFSCAMSSMKMMMELLTLTRARLHLRARAITGTALAPGLALDSSGYEQNTQLPGAEDPRSATIPWPCPSDLRLSSLPPSLHSGAETLVTCQGPPPNQPRNYYVERG